MEFYTPDNDQIRISDKEIYLFGKTYVPKLITSVRYEKIEINKITEIVKGSIIFFIILWILSLFHLSKEEQFGALFFLALGYIFMIMEMVTEKEKYNLIVGINGSESTIYTSEDPHEIFYIRDKIRKIITN